MNAKPEDLMLLDFWYLACSPCMKAMPEIAALFNKYKKRGLQVLGVNPFDDRLVRKEELTKFKTRFGVEYPLIFVAKAVTEAYKAKSFPTVYLIHKGRIAFTGIGYSKEKTAALENKIVELLGQ